jgi:diaminopropionate ammonia-lyase
VRIAGNYDESVEEAARLASESNWQVVSDTSYEGYEEVPRDVMQGYGIIAAELLESTGARPGEPGRFTHVLIQGGVGGLAAGLGSYLWEFHGEKRPRIIVIEPLQADCLFQSARSGRPVRATGTVDSVMAGLSCGEVSALAWRFLQPLVDAFVVIPDDLAVQAMQLLAAGSRRDVPLISGESGAAGLAGLLALLGNESDARLAGLGAASRILLINTEGATAPGVYERLVGERVESVRARQADWMHRAGSDAL